MSEKSPRDEGWQDLPWFGAAVVAGVGFLVGYVGVFAIGVNPLFEVDVSASKMGMWFGLIAAAGWGIASISKRWFGVYVAAGVGFLVGYVGALAIGVHPLFAVDVNARNAGILLGLIAATGRGIASMSKGSDGSSERDEASENDEPTERLPRDMEGGEFLRYGVALAVAALRKGSQGPQERREWWGLALFGVTWVGESYFAGTLRFLVGSGLALAIGLLPWDVNPNPDQWGMALMLTLWIWPALALVYPSKSSGWLWQRREGSRRPAEKEAVAIGQSCAELGIEEVQCSVINDERVFAGALGVQTMLSLGLTKSDALTPVLGHELWHLKSWDARISEGLRRMRCWFDPFAPQKDSNGVRVKGDNAWPIEWVRWIFRGAGGGWAVVALMPLWSLYFRASEYRADEHAFDLNQGPALAEHLEDEALFLDEPQPGLWLAHYAHPPVAFRMDRLEALQRGERITWRTVAEESDNWFVELGLRVLRQFEGLWQQRRPAEI
jgi:Zn-dependent protease with chaperone function